MKGKKCLKNINWKYKQYPLLLSVFSIYICFITIGLFSFSGFASADELKSNDSNNKPSESNKQEVDKRPLTLIWLVVDRENSLNWVGNDSETISLQALDMAMKRYSLRFNFPILDLNDMAAVSEQAVVRGAIDVIVQASKRYQPDAILIGNLKQKDNQWTGNWTLLKASEKNTWDNKAPDLTAAIDEMVGHFVAKLKTPIILHPEMNKISTDSNNLQTNGVTDNILLSVSGIIDAEHYIKVMGHLKTLPKVIEVEVMQIMPEKTQFKVKTTATRSELMFTIQQGQLLSNMTPLTTGESNSAPELIYKMIEGQ